MSARLYNLSFNTTERSLQSAFESEGDAVLSVTVATGPRRGYGFVQMSSDGGGLRAIAAWNGRELDGHPIVVSDASTRPSRGDPATSEFRAPKRRR
jgi:RNA recognition motif-containing protein